MNESETLVVSQQKRLDEAQHERTQLQKKVQDLAGDIKDGDHVDISAGKQGIAFNGKLAQAA